MAEPTAIYIGKLAFEDYLSLAGLNVINLIDRSGHVFQWTVFLGNNNTGKTNILKAIAGLEPIVDEGEVEPAFWTIDGKYPTSTRFDFGYKSRIDCDFYYEQNKTEANLKNKKVKPLAKFWGYELSGLIYGEFNSAYADDTCIYSYGVARRSGNKSISEKKRDFHFASLFDAEYRLTNIDEWLFQLDYASKNGQSAATERLQLLKEIIKSEILPEILDFRFTTSAELKNYIEYQTKGGWFLFEQLGYGYQATMSWVIDLCKKMFERYPESSSPLKEPAIVLVDELDLHLHPKWQKSIVSYLSKTFTATQFIVTTHSPLILQTIEKVNLFALIKAEDRVNIRHIPTETLEGWSVEEILRDVMDMEEGVYSDRHNELYKQFDKALDDDNYTNALTAYNELMEILHPTSPERKILQLQLSQITPVNDKA